MKPPRSALGKHCRKFEAHCMVRRSGRPRLVAQQPILEFFVARSVNTLRPLMKAEN